MKSPINFAIPLIVLLASCGTLTKTGRVVESSIVTIPDTFRTKLFIDTSRRLEGVSIKKTFLFFTTGSGNNFVSNGVASDPLDIYKSIKSAAIYNALDGTNNDILVLPKFTILKQKTLLTTKVTVKVTGYGAYQRVIK
jgi:hypothetical protein